ncbi:hypothetical protein FOY91_08125 [Sphingomonas solaris]|uniref:Lytic transglycosylase domain-containing protein n=1 Tax=Alterirhizorhabdus solaris TaxID=2529389 RepID=A0A558R6R3_9SPHN|nr:hypothetical protein FOY91_08125 [Sphingomonas solaris]
MIAATALLSLGTSFSAEAAAYLFWRPPVFTGTPVKGDEPGLGLPMPKATAKETAAHLLWNMRAGLNVAALQCQFAPALMTVRNYNEILRQHGEELNGAYQSISGYFKRTGGKAWQTALDQYTTRTYNGFSTLYAQMGFCETAGSIGRDALDRRKGDLHTTAETRMREFRNSLVPAGDGLYALRLSYIQTNMQLPSLDAKCWDKKDRLRKACGGTA